MYKASWLYDLFVRGQSGLSGRRSLSPRVSPSRAPFLSCAKYFQAPVTQAIENNAYAKFWVANKVHYGRCASGV